VPGLCTTCDLKTFVSSFGLLDNPTAPAFVFWTKRTFQTSEPCDQTDADESSELAFRPDHSMMVD